jgi:hypothetical protein
MDHSLVLLTHAAPAIAECTAGFFSAAALPPRINTAHLY